MSIREEIEEREERELSPFASLSSESRGRDRREEPDEFRTAYMRDRDRIIHCKAFRRLKDKTQVFLLPLGDHYRTRLTHTLEVAQISKTAARALRLNEDLTEAIALGHDLGHTPFGHAGERALDEALKEENLRKLFPAEVPLKGFHFRHNEQSVRVVERLEKDGEGLNLTAEVRDGILNHEIHTGAASPFTCEGQVVRLCDKIAYVHHDLDDAVRANIFGEEKVPEALKMKLGDSRKKRLDTFIKDMVTASKGEGEVRLSDGIMDALMDMRRFMNEELYTNPAAKSEEKKAELMVRTLFEYYIKNPDKLPEKEQAAADREGFCRALDGGSDEARAKGAERLIVAVTDYISGMTDMYAVRTYSELFIPKPWSVY